MQASFYNQIEVVKMLMEARADPFFRDNHVRSISSCFISFSCFIGQNSKRCCERKGSFWSWNIFGGIWERFWGIERFEMNFVNICENRRRWRSDEEMGRVIWINESSKNWNQFSNPIENRFMIFLWTEKMKNWLQFYQNFLFWWIWEKIIKHRFFLPLKDIIFQLVIFFLIWELICFWNQAKIRFIG